jgi:hypothetical protein
MNLDRLRISDLSEDAVDVVCDCGRSWRHSVYQLFIAYGDIQLSRLLAVITPDCPRRSRLPGNPCAVRLVFAARSRNTDATASRRHP